jgi:colicin import membrane protein
MNAITQKNNELVTIEFPYAEDVILDRAEKYSNLVISDNKSFDATRAARTEMVSIRTSIEKALKIGNEPLNNQIKANRDEAKRLIELAKPTEDYLQKTVKDYEAKKEAEREAKIQAERARVENIQNYIAAFAKMAHVTSSMNADDVRDTINDVKSIEVDDFYEEFKEQANQAKSEAIASLEISLIEKLEQERQDEARKAEAERLRLEAEKQAQERAEFEAKQAAAQAELDRQRREIEQQKIAAENAELARQAAIAKAEQERIDAIEAERLEKEREDQARIVAEAKAKADAEAARLAEEEHKRLMPELERLKGEIMAAMDCISQDGYQSEFILIMATNIRLGLGCAIDELNDKQESN